MYRREGSVRETAVPQRRKTPSFSSSLLDAIYRSIDESANGDEATLCHYRETKTTLVKKQNNAPSEEERRVSSLRRAIMIEDWVEKQSGYGSAVHFNSTSSSSDSSSGGIFSSSEAESSYKEKSRRSTPAKPEKSKQFEQRNFDNNNNNQQRAKREGGGFSKTKLKALKIYGELKKVKQPISPGGRITNFLNSIFNANAKKVKMCSVGVSDDVSFDRKSKTTCSSASSFSRSCLSKTPSARGNKYSNGKKRSVRFCPVSVIVDEDCRPCGHKCIYEDDPSLMPTSTVQKNVKSSSRKEELKNFVKEKESGVSNKARDYLRSYQRRGTGKLDLRGFVDDYEDDDEEEEDDALSYSSSDLFELDHLIGIGRYREELPVYETTSLKTKQAIANGFIL
ncbi:PREDICTED: protein BIG GRAIN 1-like C [Theobroma cacao]|uniref:Protein BIG GRAIN 1-like C n=1 Tax=Theobroma cacao TaxID=3641 RepID=A0AB32WRG4_THECC|nr:PREDICTED: protein BIG GRAIN 1-like C [Theobroma cacao]